MTTATATPAKTRPQVPPMPRKNNPSIELGDGSHIETMEITPDFAQELLDRRHAHQRPIRPRAVKAYASDMRLGRWRVTGDAIKLDHNLQVIDGQHRLQAIVESGCAFVKVPVAVLKDADAIKSIDQGMPRSLADMCYTNNVEPGGRRVVGAIFAEHFGWLEWGRTPREDQLAILAAFPYMAEVKELERVGAKEKLATIGPVSAAIHCMKAHKADAVAYFTGVFTMNPVITTGRGVEEVESVRLLYTYLHQVKTSKFARPRSAAVTRESAYKAIRAWNAWRKGETLTKLQYMPGASMPEAEF